MLDLGFLTSLHNSLILPFSWGMRGSTGHPTVAAGSLLDVVPRKAGNATSILLGLIVRLGSVGILSLTSAEAGCTGA